MRKGDAEFEFRDSKACVGLDLDGSGRADVCSGWGFLDHMLAAFSRTGQLDLTLRVEGGLWKAEALGNAIGLALGSALGDCSGIRRYGSAAIPMDDALAEIALDFGGRAYLVFLGEFEGERIGDFDVQQIKPLLESLTQGARLTLHMRFSGENDHHKAESIFKALGLAVRQAARREGAGVPSTKGII